MSRRRFLAQAGASALVPLLGPACAPSSKPAATSAGATFRRVRPSDPAWPSTASWERLNREVGGQLVSVQSPLGACVESMQSPACQDFVAHAKNPYYLGDEVGLTQTLGWVDAWTSRPSVYAVAARTTADVVATVNFARDNRLRLVVKGGGHSYLGTSSAPDSLLIWTRRMNAIALHDAFVGTDCAGRERPEPAVTVGAGAMWVHAYDAVTTRAGRYVQGGGCLTVGVAGLIQSGGFGSFSKRYGLAAAGLLEAEIVTADGAIRIANACTNPDLFWGLKGGGGGSLGVVTRLTLRTRELPEFFGATNATIKAASGDAYRRLIDRIMTFYATSLLNPHWGEQIAFRPDNTLVIRMVFQGLTRQQAEAVWRPFLDWVAASPREFTVVGAPLIVAVPARRFWDPALLRSVAALLLGRELSEAACGQGHVRPRRALLRPPRRGQRAMERRRVRIHGRATKWPPIPPDLSHFALSFRSSYGAE